MLDISVSFASGFAQCQLSKRIFKFVKKVYLTSVWILIISCLLQRAENGHALMMKMSLEDLSREASSIVVGEVIALQSQWEGRNIFTYVKISVEQYVKGIGKDEVTIRIPGGRVDDIIEYVSDTPIFRIGERSLLFLKDDFFQIVGWEQGKFAIVNHKVVFENNIEHEVDLRNRIRNILGMPMQEGERELERAVIESTIAITNITPTTTASGTRGKQPFGPGGGISDIVISGSGFGSSPGLVSFPGSYSDKIYSWSDSRIECHIPNDVYSGNIVVYNADGASSNPYNYVITFGTWWFLSDGVPFPHEVKWPKPAMGENYLVNENCANVTDELSAIQAAMTTWNQAGADFTFSYGGLTSKSNTEYDSDNIIAWNDLGPGKFATNYIWFNVYSIHGLLGDMIESDIIFNTDYIWSTTGEAGKMDIQSVATHALGKSLHLISMYGIEDKEKTMYGVILPGETKLRSLEPDDINGILYLYGAASAPVLTSFNINNGALTTMSQTVTLNNVATNDPTHYMASENSDLSGASWQTYSTSPSFTLSSGYGTKIVYLRVKNTIGESNTMSDSIEYISVPDIAIDPATWNYGDVVVGINSDKTFTVSNPGNATLNVTAISIIGDSSFSIQSGGGSFSLNPGATHDIVVRFAPTSSGNKSATLSLTNNTADKNPLNVSLQGNGAVPDIAVTPESWDYGNIVIGSHSDKTFNVSNPGNATLNVTATNLTGDSSFSIQSGGGSFSLNPGATHNIVVRFAPTSSGSKSATLSLANNVAGKNPLNVTLQGTGIGAPDIAVTPESWDYGSIVIGGHSDKTFTVSNPGNATLNVTVISIIGDNSFSIQSGGGSFSLNPGATHDIVVRFAPTLSGSKSATLSLANNVAGKSPLNIPLQGACGATIYVATSGDDTTGNGSQSKPYRTIQKGIDRAADGCIILVADGTYKGTGNVNLDFSGKGITVKSLNGAASCIIDCENKNDTCGVNFYSNEDPNSILDGFTIRNGNFSSLGGGIYCQESSPKIINNIITGNSAEYGYGGGIYCISSSPIIMNNKITGNISTYGGGICCIWCNWDPPPTLINNIITGNSADYGGGIYCNDSSAKLINNTVSGNTNGGIRCTDSASATIINSILWGNIPQEISFWELGRPNSVTISYSDIKDGYAGIVTNNNGTVNWLDGNIDMNPLFLDAVNSDYHLSDYSPCIGAGTSIDAPATDIEGYPRPNPSGSDPDIGAYENSRSNPLALVETKIQLRKGRNLISICSNPVNPSISSVLDAVEHHYNGVWAYDTNSGSWKRYIPDGPGSQNDLDVMESGKGYCINMAGTEEVELTIIGTPITDTTVQLRGGWNFVGYNSRSIQSLEDAMSGVPYTLICTLEYNSDTGNWEWLKHIKNGPTFLNTLTGLDPGKAYWIHIEQDWPWTVSY